MRLTSWDSMFVYPPICRLEPTAGASFGQRLHGCFDEIKDRVVDDAMPGWGRWSQHKWLGAQARKQREELRRLWQLCAAELVNCANEPDNAALFYTPK